jgi:hypothetical protein
MTGFLIIGSPVKKLSHFNQNLTGQGDQIGWRKNRPNCSPNSNFAKFEFSTEKMPNNFIYILLCIILKNRKGKKIAQLCQIVAHSGHPARKKRRRHTNKWNGGQYCKTSLLIFRCGNRVARYFCEKSTVASESHPKSQLWWNSMGYLFVEKGPKIEKKNRPKVENSPNLVTLWGNKKTD